MASIYIIENTAGTLSFTLEPGTLNGPGSAQRNSDLRLYGMGALQWGEGVDENFLRLAENFACPEKETNDYNPASGSHDFDKAVNRRTPKDDVDLGPGKGISVPQDGQIWFNTTDRQIYVFDSQIEEGSPAVVVGGWRTIVSTNANTIPPEEAQLGDIWFNTNTSGTVSGQYELWVYNPDHPDALPPGGSPEELVGWVSVLEDYIAETGGAMGGDLSMSNDGGTTKNYITNLATTDGTDIYDAVNVDYLNQQIDLITGPGGTLSLHMADDNAHLSSIQNELLDAIQSNCVPTTIAAQSLANDICALNGYASGVGSIFTSVNGKVNRVGDTMTGFLTLNANPTSNLHAATKQYVDNNTTGKVNRSGDTMTGALNVVHPPTADNHAASKKYIDDTVNSVTDIGNAARLVRYFNGAPTVPVPNPNNGDIGTNGSTIYIWASGAWRKVFPAVYS